MTRAIELNPNYAIAYNNRGGVYRSKGNFDRAIEDCSKAIALKPDYADAYNYRGIACHQKREFDCAIKDFDKAIELNPKHIDAYDNRAKTFEGKGCYMPAVEDFSKVIELYVGDAGDPAVDYNMGETSIPYDVWFTKARNPFMHYKRGIVWLYIREWKKARLDLIYARDMMVAIAIAFREDYGSVADFQNRTDITLPEDITAMLTPQQ